MAQPIFRDTLVMAHSLKLRVIATGIENQAQLAILPELDCDEAQGFFFSRPLPAVEFEAFMDATEPIKFPA